MEQHHQIDQTLSHLFRHESGKMVAVLVKIFGPENLSLAEDVVQDALVRALENWKFNGLPEQPRAWLYRTARNRAIDLIRRQKHSQTFDFSDPERLLLSSEYTLASTMDQFWQESQIRDDFLGMMFACCHPDISEENQLTLMLKSLCGFSTKEVARAFLSSEDTISKRLYRTKEYFRTHKIRPQIPDSSALSSRLDTVLRAIYLIFNEGYNSTHSDQLIREDLIAQALYLGKELLKNEKTRLPEVYALMALMCFHAARSHSRLTQEGELILLAKQDRSRWDAELIRAGNDYLNRSASGEVLSNYHLEAAIAYEHCTAERYEGTNWQAILGYYDLLLAKAFDPVVFLNRCLVLLELEGPQAAYEALCQLPPSRQLKQYYLYHGILGAIHEKSGRRPDALTAYRQALHLTQSQPEKHLLQDKISALEN